MNRLVIDIINSSGQGGIYIYPSIYSIPNIENPYQEVLDRSLFKPVISVISKPHMIYTSQVEWDYRSTKTKKVYWMITWCPLDMHIQSECKVQVSKTGRILKFSLEVACRRPLLQHDPFHMAQGWPVNFHFNTQKSHTSFFLSSKSHTSFFFIP